MEKGFSGPELEKVNVLWEKLIVTYSASVLPLGNRILIIFRMSMHTTQRLHFLFSLATEKQVEVMCKNAIM